MWYLAVTWGGGAHSRSKVWVRGAARISRWGRKEKRQLRKERPKARGQCLGTRKGRVERWSQVLKKRSLLAWVPSLEPMVERDRTLDSWPLTSIHMPWYLSPPPPHTWITNRFSKVEKEEPPCFTIRRLWTQWAGEGRKHIVPVYHVDGEWGNLAIK